MIAGHCPHSGLMIRGRGRGCGPSHLKHVANDHHLRGWDALTARSPHALTGGDRVTEGFIIITEITQGSGPSGEWGVRSFFIEGEKCPPGVGLSY